MAEQQISEGDLGLKKVDPRTAAVPALKDFVRGQEATIGTTPEARVAWLGGLQPADLSQFLIDLNGTARGITDKHTFDGEGVVAGTIGGSVPPDQPDKEPILHYALAEIQRIGQDMREGGADPQSILDRAAVVLPTIVNKLHLFGDGNGRTSRVLRMILRDGITHADAGIDAIVSKDGFNSYDTTPSAPAENAVIRKLKERHGTDDIKVDEDFDGAVVIEDYLAEIRAIPGIDPKTIKSWLDTANFNETARVFAKKHQVGSQGQDGNTHISLQGFLTDLGADPDKQTEFLEGYRQIRQEIVMLWVDGLTGKTDLPLTDHDRWLNSINFGRRQKGQPDLVDGDIGTAATLQTAYVESQSPLRPQ